MLIGIRRGPLPASSPPGADEIVILLLACHERIRSFLELASRLVAADQDASVSDAATGLSRYFGTALPLHSLDEDASIAPRLLAAGASNEVRAALDEGAREHAVMAEIINALVVSWSDVARDPRLLPAHRPSLAAGTARLDGLFPDHLAREEQLVFPLIPRLPEAIRAAILGEMRERRAGAGGARG